MKTNAFLNWKKICTSFHQARKKTSNNWSISSLLLPYNLVTSHLLLFANLYLKYKFLQNGLPPNETFASAILNCVTKMFLSISLPVISRYIYILIYRILCIYARWDCFACFPARSGVLLQYAANRWQHFTEERSSTFTGRVVWWMINFGSVIAQLKDKLRVQWSTHNNTPTIYALLALQMQPVSLSQLLSDLYKMSNIHYFIPISCHLCTIYPNLQE